MNKPYKLLTLVFLGLIIDISLFSAVTLDEYLKAYKKVQSFSAQFKQTKHLSVMASDQVSTGYIQFKKTDKLVWALKTPYSYKFILNGKKVIKAYPDLDEQQVYDIDENIQLKTLFDNIFLLMGLKKRQAIENKYQIVKGRGNTIILIPRQKSFKKYVKKIILKFNKKKYIRSIKILEPSEDYTLIRFFDIQINPTISDKVFEIK